MPLNETLGAARPRNGAPAAREELHADRPETPEAPVVLLVDDDADFRKALAAALKGVGFLPVCAECARAANEAVRSRRPAAAVVDLMLPDMTGLELIHEWRINARMKMRDVPVLVLTGRTEQEDHAAAEVLGVADYLIKPVDFAELVAQLRRVIGDEARQAFRSPLTGLPGAVALDEEMRRLMVSEAPWAMLTVNIKGLHRLNERFGYQRGDQAIRTLAAALWSTADRQAYHVSGDVFVELMPPDALDNEARAVMAGFALFQRQLEDLSAPDAPETPEPEAEPGAEQPAPLALAAAGLVVEAGPRELTLPEIRQLVDGLMKDAKREPGNCFVRHVVR